MSEVGVNLGVSSLDPPGSVGGGAIGVTVVPGEQ